MQSGLQIVRELVEQRKKVFLDLKIDDTPRTIQGGGAQCGGGGRRVFYLAG